MDFSLEFSLSLVENKAVAEWGGEPIERGLYQHMYGRGAFVGFFMEFEIEAKCLLPTPGPAELASFATFLGSFVSNPMGIVTGAVPAPSTGILLLTFLLLTFFHFTS